MSLGCRCLLGLAVVAAVWGRPALASPWDRCGGVSLKVPADLSPEEARRTLETVAMWRYTDRFGLTRGAWEDTGNAAALLARDGDIESLSNVLGDLEGLLVEDRRHYSTPASLMRRQLVVATCVSLLADDPSDEDLVSRDRAIQGGDVFRPLLTGALEVLFWERLRTRGWVDGASGVLLGDDERHRHRWWGRILDQMPRAHPPREVLEAMFALARPPDEARGLPVAIWRGLTYWAARDEWWARAAGAFSADGRGAVPPLRGDPANQPQAGWSGDSLLGLEPGQLVRGFPRGSPLAEAFRVERIVRARRLLTPQEAADLRRPIARHWYFIQLSGSIRWFRNFTHEGDYMGAISNRMRRSMVNDTWVTPAYGPTDQIVLPLADQGQALEDSLLWIADSLGQDADSGRSLTAVLDATRFGIHHLGLWLGDGETTVVPVEESEVVLGLRSNDEGLRLLGIEAPEARIRLPDPPGPWR